MVFIILGISFQGRDGMDWNLALAVHKSPKQLDFNIDSNSDTFRVQSVQ